ncbi:hypothetical protein [Halorubrum sp. LN27]|uniref:hypothetical protein n=1 Tax=Halorubrum sp. LN27 TaxID=2801032 RepID=UPI00190A1231|nr:hypothetical protein [Halorubrum sp. LN27]
MAPDRRRALRLAGACLLGIPSAGCLSTADPVASEDSERSEPPGDSEASEPDYDQCHLVRIEYHRLPGDVRTEIDAALENGDYRSESLRFDDAVDASYSYVVIDDTPYDPRVEDVDSEAKTLMLTEVDSVRKPDPPSLTVRNTADREHEVRIELAGEEPLVDETVTIESHDFRKYHPTDEFGSYELTVETLTGSEETRRFDFVVDDFRTEAEVTITDDEVHVSQGVIDYAPCEWDG